MFCLNALFKHSLDLWLTLNIEVLTTADATFELFVNKCRSDATSSGYTFIATGYSTTANGYFGQMSPSPAASHVKLLQTVSKCEFTVRYSHPFDSLPEPWGFKHLTPSMFSFTPSKCSKLSISTHPHTHIPFHMNMCGWYLYWHHPPSWCTIFKCHMWSACVLGTMRGIVFPGKT